MLSFSKIGALVFVGFVLLSIFVVNTYNNCSGGGILFDPCKLGPGFFLLPITLLVTLLGKKEPLWWDDGQQNWIIIVGVLYGVISYLLISLIEKKLEELDKR